MPYYDVKPWRSPPHSVSMALAMLQWLSEVHWELIFRARHFLSVLKIRNNFVAQGPLKAYHSGRSTPPSGARRRGAFDCRGWGLGSGNFSTDTTFSRIGEVCRRGAGAVSAFEPPLTRRSGRPSALPYSGPQPRSWESSIR